MPGTSAPELNEPDSLHLILTTRPVALLEIVTSAPLITAPEGSLTVPTMLPVPIVDCAERRRGKLNTTRSTPATILGTHWRQCGWETDIFLKFRERADGATAKNSPSQCQNSTVTPLKPRAPRKLLSG